MWLTIGMIVKKLKLPLIKDYIWKVRAPKKHCNCVLGVDLHLRWCHQFAFLH